MSRSPVDLRKKMAESLKKVEENPELGMTFSQKYKTPLFDTERISLELD